MPARVKKDPVIERLLARRFPGDWEAWLWENMAHYRLLSDAERARLKDDTRVLMAQKSWEGCDGLQVTEIMKLTVSAQSALLLLGLDHDYFSEVQSIVLFPKAFEQVSGDGRGRVLTGQAVKYGTVFLSWETTLTEGRNPEAGHNLVIHEFAHQLDFLDGYTNGAPLLRNHDQTQRWKRVMHEAYNRLRRDLLRQDKSFLGSYAATNPTEFFSVVSEKFFCLPALLQQQHQELFGVLAEYYRVDPLRWFEDETAERADSPPAVPSDNQAPETEDLGDSAAVQILGFDFIDFKCPYCQNPISFPKQDAGTLKQCPNCLESMIVPDRTDAPAQRLPFPIQAERLVIRRFQSLDAEDLADVAASPDTLRYLNWTPVRLEEAEEWIASQNAIPFPQSDQTGYFAVQSIETARVIGIAAIWFPSGNFNVAQFLLIINPDHQRKGFGTETVRGILSFLFTGLPARRVIAVCDARNLSARRMLLKAGLRQESECIQDRLVNGEWVNSAGFALLRHEYEQQCANAKP